MEEEHHDADEPHVGEIAEHDQEGAQTVVQGILVEIALCADEDVGQEPADVLAELKDIVVSHLVGGFVEREEIFVHVERVSPASQPAGHEGGGQKQKICPNRYWQVV